MKAVGDFKTGRGAGVNVKICTFPTFTSHPHNCLVWFWQETLYEAARPVEKTEGAHKLQSDQRDKLSAISNNNHQSTLTGTGWPGAD